MNWQRYSLTIILLLATGYLVGDFGWKSAIAFTTALFALIAKEVSDYLQQSRDTTAKPQVREQDRTLFNKFLELLPSDGAIDFVDKHNMAGFSFDLEEIRPIGIFLHEWDNPEHEFIDVDLQHAKDELMQACRAWSATIGTETFQMNNGRQSVPAEWEYEQPDRFDRVVSQLHQQAQDIVDKHKRLVRIGKRRLLN